MIATSFTSASGQEIRGQPAVPISRDSFSTVIAFGAGMGVPREDVDAILRLTPRGEIAVPMSAVSHHEPALSIALARYVSAVHQRARPAAILLNDGPVSGSAVTSP